MGVYLKPCTGCPLRDGCKLRDEFRRRVNGLGLRSATFRCDVLAKALSPGTRIIVSHPITVETGGDYHSGPQYDVVREDLPATITSSDCDEFSCIIDREALVAAIEAQEGEGLDKVDTYRFRKTMKARRIVRFLDEPKRCQCDGHRWLLPSGGCDKRPDEDCSCAFTRQYKTNRADRPTSGDTHG